jgi:urease accessory protein
MRAIKVLKPGEAHSGLIVDTLILSLEERQAAQGTLTGVNGVAVEIAEPLRLRADDRVLLDDGSLVEIVAQPEPLIEARAADLPALARLAWHLGDRHVPVQIFERRLRLRRDPAIEALPAKLGAKVLVIEAPFEPEGGAYEAAVAHHDHHHDHEHDHHGHEHDHGHHDHGHHHDHAHDHSHDHDHEGHKPHAGCC